jgi:hypothetical protein
LTARNGSALHDAISLQGLLNGNEGDAISLIQKPQDTVEYVENVFQKFKLKLHAASERFEEAKTGKPRFSIQDIFQSEPTPKITQVELIAIPTIPMHSKDFHNLGILGVADPELRKEELRLLRFEDERRKIIVAESHLEATLNFSQQLFQNISKHASLHYANPRNFHAEEFNSSITDIDSAFSFLAKGRTLLLNERISKEYQFVLASYLEDDTVNPHFAFEWSDTNQLELNHAPDGYVLLEDIMSVQVASFDNRIFFIALKESVRALRNAKGRTSLPIKCSSPLEAVNYVQSLDIIIQALEH